MSKVIDELDGIQLLDVDGIHCLAGEGILPYAIPADITTVSDALNWLIPIEDGETTS